MRWWKSAVLHVQGLLQLLGCLLNRILNNDQHVQYIATFSSESREVQYDLRTRPHDSLLSTKTADLSDRTLYCRAMSLCHRTTKLCRRRRPIDALFFSLLLFSCSIFPPKFVLACASPTRMGTSTIDLKV